MVAIGLVTINASANNMPWWNHNDPNAVDVSSTVVRALGEQPIIFVIA
jgi:hypothetical protein